MLRITVDVENGPGDMLATKETLAMLLEPMGKIRVVAIVDPEREGKR